MNFICEGKNKKFVLGATIAVIIAAAIAFVAVRAISTHHAAVAKGHVHGGADIAADDKQAPYYCPMHPTYTSDKPGECPICGMTLVPMKDEKKPSGGGAPKLSSAGRGGHESVTVSEDQQRTIGVKTSPVKREKAEITMRTYGKVAYDPELAVAQREYLEALRLGDTSFSEAARQRLLLLGMGEAQIKNLAHEGVQRELYSQGKNAWVYLTIYQNELPLVEVGQKAILELPNGKGTREGIVRAVDPVLDEATRTARARVEVKNEDGALRPNMFVTGTITKDLGEKLTIPKEAVIDSGERRMAFVVHEKTHFMPHDVVLGPELSSSYVLESGVEEGDEVVTSSNFLIDSESRMKAAIGQSAQHKH